MSLVQFGVLVQPGVDVALSQQRSWVQIPYTSLKESQVLKFTVMSHKEFFAEVSKMITYSNLSLSELSAEEYANTFSRALNNLHSNGYKFVQMLDSVVVFENV